MRFLPPFNRNRGRRPPPRSPHWERGQVGDWFDTEQAAAGVTGIWLRLDDDSDSILIAFGGLGAGIGIPVFEFFNVVSRLERPVKQVFVRDPYGAWYHCGVVGAGDTIDEVAAHLRDVVREVGPRKVVTVGNSAGGYAALLFGNLIEAAEVLAFGPQTFITRRHRLIHRDRRFSGPLRRLWSSGCYDPSYGDLRAVFAARNNTTTRFVIHHSVNHRLDSLHARRMRDLPGVELREYECEKRALVKQLRDRGELQRLLEAALTG